MSHFPLQLKKNLYNLEPLIGLDFTCSFSNLHLCHRMLNVPLVFRVDTSGDGNNTRTVQLFGHPRLLRLPNQLECQQLHEAVMSLMPYSNQYKILLVDGQVNQYG